MLMQTVPEGPFSSIDLKQAARDLVSEIAGNSERKKKNLPSADGLELFLLYVRAQGTVPAHQVPGAITIQGILGKAMVAAEGQEHELTPDTIVSIGGGIPHDLRATTECVLLVTRVLHV
jgi:quercetin dioxygenase-like cupin family protein